MNHYTGHLHFAHRSLLALIILFMGTFVVVQAAAEELHFTSEVINDQQSSIQTQQVDRRVLGQNLFDGKFGQQRFSGFNPNYRITVGDRLSVQLWGAVESQSEQVVDAQGNIFLPQVGPVSVAGELNNQLNEIVSSALTRVYKKDVYVYVNLVASQPVKLFVTGNVMSPGLYSGLSSESLLAYLDRAGGVDPLRGSYLDIQLKRAGELLESVNLYQFLVNGTLNQRQLQEGDVIVVGSRQFVISFEGLVENPFQIEFATKAVTLSEAMALVQPLPSATHIAIERNQGLIKEVEYINIADALEQQLILNADDNVRFVADKIQGSIGVQVEGEHSGQAQYVLPYGAKMADLLRLVQINDRSNLQGLQLYRQSLIKQQSEALHTTLDILQSQVLAARSDTVEEASLRSQEAKLMMEFIQRAKQVMPKGQVVLDDSLPIDEVFLENGDIVVIPAKTNLVRISGEVLFPNSVIFDPALNVDDYVKLAGGHMQQAKKSRIILRKVNGSTVEVKNKNGMVKNIAWQIEAGDEILVLPSVDVKSLQHAKDIFQIIYQLALSAGVVLKI